MPDLLGALAIFCFRVLDVSLGTARSLLAVRGHKYVAASLGFVEAIVFVLAISRVINHLDNPFNIVGYAAGFATGNVVGVTVEGWLGIGYQTVHVISAEASLEIVEQLREAGFGVTTFTGQGRNGPVVMLLVMVRRKRVRQLLETVRNVDPSAFVTVEELRSALHGYLPQAKRK